MRLIIIIAFCFSATIGCQRINPLIPKPPQVTEITETEVVSVNENGITINIELDATLTQK